MNLNVYIICVVAAVLLAVPAEADSTATIHGEVYGWDTFEPLKNTVVEVNSTPSQSMVAKYGVYSFALEPGDYLIKASYYQNSTLVYSAEEPITIKGEGSYVLDLLLLPVYPEVLMDSSEEKEISVNPEDTENSSITTQVVSNGSDVNNSDAENSSDGNISVVETGEINGSASSIGYYLLAALVVSLFLAGGYRFQKHKSIEKNRPENNRPENNRPENGKLKESQPETDKLEKNRLLEEKVEYRTDKPSMPANTLDFSSRVSEERVEPKTEQELTVGPMEAQLSGQSSGASDLEEAREERKKAENIEGKLRLEMEPAHLKQEAEKGKEMSPGELTSEGLFTEKSVQIPEPAKMPEPVKVPESEVPPPKKNLPLPADLQEVMDIIRGQGGRITQKDLRSKLKYSEGKVSLMLADLERRELIEKFKRGRGNVIILRDEER